VVSGQGGLGEVTIAGSTHAIEVLENGTLREHRWTAAEFGLPATESPDDLTVENAQQSADIIQSVLSGKAGAARDIVVANAAAAIWIAGKATTLRDGAALAHQAIDSGTAKHLLERLIQATNT